MQGSAVLASRLACPLREYGARAITQHAALRSLGTCSSWPLQPTNLPPTTRTALGLDGSSTCQKELPVVVPAVPIPPWGVPFFLFAHPALVLGLETETIQNGNGPLVAAHPRMRLQFRCLSYTQHPAPNIRDHIDHSPSTMHAVLSCLFPQAPFFFPLLHGLESCAAMVMTLQCALQRSWDRFFCQAPVGYSFPDESMLPGSHGEQSRHCQFLPDHGLAPFTVRPRPPLSRCDAFPMLLPRSHLII